MEAGSAPISAKVRGMPSSRRKFLKASTPSRAVRLGSSKSIWQPKMRVAIWAKRSASLCSTQ